MSDWMKNKVNKCNRGLPWTYHTSKFTLLRAAQSLCNFLLFSRRPISAQCSEDIKTFNLFVIIRQQRSSHLLWVLAFDTNSFILKMLPARDRTCNFLPVPSWPLLHCLCQQRIEFNKGLMAFLNVHGQTWVTQIHSSVNAPYETM